MAVVIRLQGLPMVAGTMDIRHFFSGLTIPDGGVHIVGGEHGEAFIVFATDEDARLGMMRTGGAIKGSKVSLLLSSKTEMQNMIELSRRRFETGPVATETQPPAASNRQSGPPTAPGNQPGGAGRGGGHGNQAGVAQEQQGSKAPPTCLPSMLPNFANSYSPAPSLSSAPPIPPLPNMPSMPPLPTLPSMPLPPPVPTGPPQPPMAHLPHMSSMPPFNPSMPPPAGLGSGLPLGAPGPLLFSPLAPLASLGLQAHMKASAGPPDQMFVLLQNLPFSCSEGEVRDFLRGLGVEGVRLLRDHQGRGTGRALVRFFSPQDGLEAVKRGGGMMGQRFIEIAPATERQWASLNGNAGPAPLNNNNNAAAANKTNSNNEEQQHRRGNAGAGPRERARSRSPQRQELCVYLKGLPYEAEKKQIQEFFKNLSIMEDSVYIAYGPNGRATGEGFLEFRTEQDYKTALGAHMQYMGSRFIQVHPISRKGMLEKIDAIRKRASTQGDGKNQDGSKAPRNCAHITNLPYSIAKKDVRAFLEGVGLYEESLKVLTDNHGNGLGQAVFQLRSEEDARKAERLHRQKLNGRDAFVHLVTYEQMKEIERNPPPQNKRGQRTQGQSQHQPSPQPGQINPFAGMSGEEFNFLRSTMGTLGTAPFVSPFAAPGGGLAGPPPLPPLAAGLGEGCLGVAPPLVAGLPGPILDPSGFRPPLGQEALRGLAPFDGASRKPGGGAGGGVANSNNQARPGGGAAGADPLRNQPAPGGPGNHGGGPGNLGGGPGNQHGGGPTIVKLQNMPFTVTVDEILDFFYGYQVMQGSVCLQFSDKGLPTGEAMVAFQSPSEAAAAVMDLNDRPIGARKVKISLG